MVEHKNIQEAMVAIMAEVDPIEKSKTAGDLKYKFRGVDDVYQGLQKLMAMHGVFTTSRVVSEPCYTEHTTSKGTATFRARIIFEFTFWHTTGTNVTSEVIGEGVDSGDKGVNKAMSVAHKYALLQAFMIPTDDPKDPEGESHELLDKRRVEEARLAEEARVAREAKATGEAKRAEVKAYVLEKAGKLSDPQKDEINSVFKTAGINIETLESVKKMVDDFLAGAKTLDEAAALFNGEVEK